MPRVARFPDLRLTAACRRIENTRQTWVMVLAGSLLFQRSCYSHEAHAVDAALRYVVRAASARICRDAIIW